MTDHAIVVDGLVKRFASVVALDRVDFVVEQGTVFGLLGVHRASR